MPRLEREFLLLFSPRESILLVFYSKGQKATTMEVFDSHAHIYPEKIATRASDAIGKFYDLEMDCNGTAESLLRLGKEAGISRFVVHSVATNARQVSHINDFICAEKEKHPEFIPFMALHQDMSEEEIDEEVALRVKQGFYGIKLHPDFQKFAINSEEGKKLYRVVGGRLPFLLHTGDVRYNYSHPSFMAEAAREFPETRFIGAHFGGWSCWRDAHVYYKGLDNVFFDTSSSLYAMDRETSAALIRCLGADRFFFGTDYPMWKPVEEVQRFLALPLTQTEKEKILAENLKLFLKI